MTNFDITVIVPVYNVEQYLRQCLESIVHQTMASIQIICVNDGSTDSSKAILDEYVVNDPRISIIDKPNGGLSSARNRAYPFIKGKYTLFVDSDDWIELDLCEKAFRKAEESKAPITVFFYHRYQKDGVKYSRLAHSEITSSDKVTVAEKIPILDYASAWGKLWRTDFLLDNHLYFPEGLVCEDQLVHWQAVTIAEKIVMIPEGLYHYRTNPNSIMQVKGEHSMDIVPIYKMIGDYLVESGHYADYKEKYISTKLIIWYDCYLTLPQHLKEKCKQRIRESLTEDDRIFYRQGGPYLTLPYLFYEMVDGRLGANWCYHTIDYFGKIVRYFNKIIKFPEMIFRRWVLKPIKKRFFFGGSKSSF